MDHQWVIDFPSSYFHFHAFRVHLCTFLACFRMFNSFFVWDWSLLVWRYSFFTQRNKVHCFFARGRNIVAWGNFGFTRRWRFFAWANSCFTQEPLFLCRKIHLRVRISFFVWRRDSSREEKSVSHETEHLRTRFHKFCAKFCNSFVFSHLEIALYFILMLWFDLILIIYLSFLCCACRRSLEMCHSDLIIYHMESYCGVWMTQIGDILPDWVCLHYVGFQPWWWITAFSLHW